MAQPGLHGVGTTGRGTRRSDQRTVRSRKGMPMAATPPMTATRRVDAAPAPGAWAGAVAGAGRARPRGAAAGTLRCWATIPRGSSGGADTISAGVGTVRTSVPAGGDAGALAGSIVAAGPSSAGGAGTTGAGG